MWPVSCASTPMIWLGVFEFDQRAGVDEDAAAVDDEGVEGAVVDDDDANVLLGEACGAQDRGGVFAQQLLDFGVADDWQPAAAGAGRQAGEMRRATAAAIAIAHDGWRGASLTARSLAIIETRSPPLSARSLVSP